MNLVLIALLFVALIWLVRLPSALVVTALFAVLNFTGFFQGVVYFLAYFGILGAGFFIRSRRLRREREEREAQRPRQQDRQDQRERENS